MKIGTAYFGDSRKIKYLLTYLELISVLHVHCSMHANTVSACVRNTISSLPQIDIADLQSTTGDPAFISNISVTAVPASTTYRIFYSADPCSGSTLQQLTTKRDNLTVSLRCTWTPLQRYCISSPQLAFTDTFYFISAGFFHDTN